MYYWKKLVIINNMNDEQTTIKIVKNEQLGLVEKVDLGFL
jgi:hypothetical protein